MATSEASQEKGREANDDGAAFRKLRSSEPDLKVMLNYSSEKGESQVKEYQLYSQSLAKMSKFVDTCMSVEMQEKKSREIIFDDVSPDLFESALNYLGNPLEVLTMTPTRAVELVEFYDKYEFPEGIALCDQILSNYFNPHRGYEPLDDDLGLDFCIDAAVVSEMLNLPKSKAPAVDSLGGMLYGPYGDDCETDTMYCLDQVKKMHPLFKKGHLRGHVEDLTEEEIQSPLFPKFFLERLSYRSSQWTLRHVWLSGTGTAADGEYDVEVSRSFLRHIDSRSLVYNGGAIDIVNILAEDDDWIIAGYAAGDPVLWKCPGSGNMQTPPRGPWIPVHALAKETKPTVSYHPPRRLR